MALNPESADTTETITKNEQVNTFPSTEDGGDLVDTIMPAPANAPEDKTEDKTEDKEDREQAIPRDRFDKVNGIAKEVPGLKEEIANLKGQVAGLTTKALDGDPATDGFLEKISAMDADDLRDQMDDDPTAFLKQYGEALTAQLAGNAPDTGDAFGAKVAETLGGFAKENPEFDKLWDSGEIRKHLEANPGYDAIGSFYALTAESRETAVQEKIDAAIKKTEAKFNKLLKRDNSSLPGGPAATAGGEVAPELQDTSKHGGTIQTITSRIIAGRQSG